MMLRATTIAVLAALIVLHAGCGRKEGKTATDRPGGGPAAEASTPYYAGLIEEYQRLLAEDPHNLAGNIALGNAYFDSGQWREAITAYQRALRMDPRNPDVRTDLGTAYRNAGMPERALAEYRAVLAFTPGHANAQYNVGVVYAYDKKDYASAVRVWEELLRTMPAHPQSQSMKSCIIKFKQVLKKGSE
jgi:cytochrome c-type biogenesis protein CcmH/NrfG